MQDAVVFPAVFDAQAATQAYLTTLSGEARARSDAYFQGGYALDAVGTGISLLIAALLLGTRLSARVRAALEARTGRRWLVVLGYAAFYLIASFVLASPFAVYRGFFREHAYQLSNQTFGAWLGDELKGLAVSLVLLPPALVALYAVVRRAPRSWWLWATGLGALFLAFAVLIGPVYIAPLFNTYRPMPDGPLKQDILLLARANGVPADDVEVFDASRQSTRISANVSGMLGTMHISLNDNLLERATPDEVKATMAHEIGHYVLGHVYEGLVYATVLLFVGLALVNGSFDWVNQRFGARWGVRGLEDVAGLPLLFALLAFFSFLATPIQNTITRSSEAEADLFGLNAARKPDGFAAVAMRLSTYRKIEPGPLEEWVFFDHPSGRSRVQMAMTWKAAELAAGADDLDPNSAPLVPLVAKALAEERASRTAVGSGPPAPH